MEVAQAALDGNAVAFPVEWFRVESNRQLLSRLADIQDAGGEGMVLRHPDALGYDRGRTGNLLKVKPAAAFI
jgi:ATP-dependent DNA ligase